MLLRTLSFRGQMKSPSRGALYQHFISSPSTLQSSTILLTARRKSLSLRISDEFHSSHFGPRSSRPVPRECSQVYGREKYGSDDQCNVPGKHVVLLHTQLRIKVELGHSGNQIRTKAGMGTAPANRETGNICGDPRHQISFSRRYGPASASRLQTYSPDVALAPARKLRPRSCGSKPNAAIGPKTRLPMPKPS